MAQEVGTTKGDEKLIWFRMQARTLGDLVDVTLVSVYGETCKVPCIGGLNYSLFSLEISRLRAVRRCRSTGKTFVYPVYGGIYGCTS